MAVAWPAVVAALLWCLLPDSPAPSPGLTAGAPDAPATLTPADRAAFSRYAGSHACAHCHRTAYNDWFYSHHARAERELHPVRDTDPFRPPHHVTLTSESITLSTTNGTPQITVTSTHGPTLIHQTCRAIGVAPLVQYLVPQPGGRFQITPVAHDPARHEWFHVFGTDERLPGEWGHWTGRGMNWNSMCAACHNTALRKNYQPDTDRYATTLLERGVGCEACHGPLRDHVLWQRQNPGRKPDPTLARLTPRQHLETCASCHSRRTELTGTFQPGHAFDDHFLLAMVDDTDTFYPDGQVRDENFEWAAFLGSRMHDAQIRCTDCHNPHTGRVRHRGNLLCLQCHAAGRHPGAPAINPLTHSHHPAGTTGDQCIACHMPVTVYMQRHPRHDHGFTLPDPWLTLHFGIPNACNRCHTNQTAEWSLQHVRAWYREDRFTRTRTRTAAIVAARACQPNAWQDILHTLQGQTNAYWRAVLVRFLGPYAEHPPVSSTLAQTCLDPSPLVRLATVQALQQAMERQATDPTPLLRRALADPVRNVRIAAAWALRASLDPSHPAHRELQDHLRYHADQPWGQFQIGLYHRDRGRLDQARFALERAVAWDPSSIPPRVALATVASALDDPHTAVEQLETASRLAPTNADVLFLLALALHETGNLPRARESLEQTVQLDPKHAGAWYNLGLARAALGDLQPALDALGTAETLEPDNPRIPFARATVLARLQRWEETRAAAARAWSLGLNSPEVRSFLQAGPGSAPP
ncbi:tetratricopeptide repeat protein [Limisphaera ngatamarikiensis]|uniref:Tetratricopeptide repeat protein n=1 Tax=Limisphaera ngatamarikiensis TaxID=1324935 RepID=A0A6M1RT10_9BACT|nr:tetratricopeptide repeat protein [Limisphaera ngatamarikiensis]NGO38574.1 tetratricopeptide repeat protein [Limisphaera ngatamarikiensis]